MLTTTQINQWRNSGYVVAKNILEPELVNKSQIFLNSIYNSVENVPSEFGSGGKLEFPCGKLIDYITINTNLINCVKQLLYTNDILLCQSDAWGKYGTLDKSVYSNTDQRMHMDYGNNTFLHPSPWDKPESVAVIIYLSNTNKTGGGTAIVPHKTININDNKLYDNEDELYKMPYLNMPGQKDFIFFNDRAHSEDYFKRNRPLIYDFRKKLYKREITVKANIGDILFYRLDIWHRGTPVNIGQVRNVMNLLWKKKECYWINNWNPGWTKKMYRKWLEKLFIGMSPAQRATLGVPPVGDPYWNINNIQLLRDRYPGIDVKPYYSGISRI